MFVFGWLVLSNNTFFPWNAAQFWMDFPNYGDWDTKPLEFFYYMFQLGFYLQAIVALITFETKRKVGNKKTKQVILFYFLFIKDFIELCIHHSVTILLIIFSYCSSQHRIGLNVLIIHDFSDIFLYSTKVLHYLDKFGK
jgi:hypothetical protein